VEPLWLPLLVAALLFMSSLTCLLLAYLTKKRGWFVPAGGLLALAAVVFVCA
jgi:hypothetical protein